MFFLGFRSCLVGLFFVGRFFLLSRVDGVVLGCG